MNSTNAIEKALQVKVNEECEVIVDKFINDLEKLSNKYGASSSFYDFKKDSSSDTREFMVTGTHGIASVLNRMILESHSKAMLNYKSKELIKKLDLI